MDMLIEIALKGVLPFFLAFFLGYYGMKVYYYLQDRKSK